MKKSIKAFLIAALIISLFPHANAVEGNYVETKNLSSANLNYDITAIDSFKNYIGKFFENPSEWCVIDYNGQDISDQYYNDNLSLYLSGDFESLMKKTYGIVYALDTVGPVMEAPILSSDSAEIRRATSSKHISEQFACYTTAPSSIEAEIMVAGNYEVDIADSIIHSASSSSPTVKMIGQTGGEYGVSFVVNNVTRSRVISSDKQTVTFTTTFHINSIIGESVYDVGKFQISITGDANGKFVSCTPSDRKAKPL